ncbi:MAG: hypothetical protein VX642_09645 [Bdellovibrionota bacterium]|nr:hypothetical protein [Bdellovibrionota bacterium]
MSINFDTNEIQADEIVNYSTQLGYITTQEILSDPSLENSVLRNSATSTNFCEQQEYTHYSICSFTKLSENLVATAGHCIEKLYHNRVQKKNLEKLKQFVFVYPDFKTTKLKFFDKLLFFRSIPRHFDIAIIQLKADSESIPTSLNTFMNLDFISSKRDHYAFLSYPLHRPIKVELTQKKSVKYSSRTFYLPIHSLQGSSGAPLFDLSTGELMGINISGTPDRKYDPEKQCYRELSKSEKKHSISLFQRLENLLSGNYKIQNTFEDEIHSLIQYHFKYSKLAQQTKLPESLVLHRDSLEKLKNNFKEINEIIEHHNISNDSLVEALNYSNSYKHQELSKFLNNIILQRRKHEILSSHFSTGPTYKF